MHHSMTALKGLILPGIFGCIERDGNDVLDRIRVEMADSLKHEDWYISESVTDSCLLGVVELDFLRRRNNPIYNDGKSLIGVSRGIIYNKQELGQKYGVEWSASDTNDTKFIVELYKKLDTSFLEYLNGLFVAAIYDKEMDKIVVANDRYGYYPLFYSFTSKRFIFASEAKAVLKDPAITPRIDKNAIPEFFGFSFLLGDKTFFVDVKKMGPAQLLTYDRRKDQVLLRRYWDFTLKKYDPVKPLGSYLREFNRLMKAAVERRVEDCEQVGIFLSGGLDSRIIAAFASQTQTPVITFTFGVKDCEEQKIASEVAERLGLDNIFCEIPSDFIAEYASKVVFRGDGLIRIRDCHFISFLGEIRKKVQTVLLGTFGGDLSCRPEGRLSEKLVRLRKRREIIDNLFDYYTSKASSVLPIRAQEKAFSDVFFKEIGGKAEKSFVETFDEIVFNSPSDIGDYWEYRNREPRYIFQASQHVNWYLETRHPYMDNDLVDFFAFRFPVNLRRREIFGITFEDTFLQRALIQSFPSLADIPWHGFPPNSSALRVIVAQGSRFIRKKIEQLLEKSLHRKVRLGSIDFRGYDEWLRTGSKQYALNLLMDSKALKRRYLQESFVREIIRDHMSYRANHEQLICDLINLELMNRIFFDE